MKIITIAARKGGVGKTTFAYLYSFYLSQKEKKKILLIDGDPQANLTSCFFKSEQKDSLSLILKNEKNIFDEIKKTSIDNIDIITTNIKLDFLNDEIMNFPAREKVAFRILKKEYENLTKKYDYIIIDTNPSFSLTNQNLMLIADEIIIISDRSKFGLDGVIKLAKNWKAVTDAFDLNYNINTIILNKIGNNSMSRQFTQSMLSNFSEQCCPVFLKEYSSIEKAILFDETAKSMKKLESLGNPFCEIYEWLNKKGVM